MDFQDFMNPIIRIDLTLEQNSSSAQAVQTPPLTSSYAAASLIIQSGDTLAFSKRESEMLEEFELYFYRLVGSFNDFNRPEFSKIRVISKKRYEEDLEEELRQKKMTIQIKKSTG